MPARQRVPKAGTGRRRVILSALLLLLVCTAKSLHFTCAGNLYPLLVALVPTCVNFLLLKITPVLLLALGEPVL